MNNLNGSVKNRQEMSKNEDKQSNNGSSQRIYSNCVSTHDDVCFLDTEEDPSQH